MSDREALAELLRACAPGLARRQLVLAASTSRPPPPGAWVPGVFSVQIPLRGCIELAIPVGDEDRWLRVGTRQILAVCADSWSPRNQDHARRHLALSFGKKLHLSCYQTPVNGGQRAPEFQAHIPEPGPALQACMTALRCCAERSCIEQVLQALIVAIVPLLAEELCSPELAGTTAEICAFMRQHCHEALQRDAVAARFDIGGDHLTRLLQTACGSGFVYLLHRYRLEKACDDLRDTHYAVAEVAERCGYGSASYFIRIFRRHQQVSPAQWRRSWQSGGGPAA